MPHGPKDWLDSFFSSHSQQSTSTAASTAYKTSTLTVPSSTSSMPPSNLRRVGMGRMALHGDLYAKAALDSVNGTYK
ncbi:hypothetical protein HO133_005746 [Letharia lupina]|uniref:Uncharacterized protein n=1 Tax=Letharia lupina TaxID=560253 RepID=A0A8H6C7Q3_9LECA|nr:uncharacterized protein HO133_005746 [Letharia lupina]KAF6218399.1 hypothetical protein HO133_005746 [Letharia lupina]